MAAYTTQQYFLGRLPDVATIIPGYNVDMAVNAAMALYWDRFFPKSDPIPDICDDVLTERRKILCALRAVVNIMPMVMKILKPQVLEAKGGPAEAKFEERGRLYTLMSNMWALELKQLEEMEGIIFGLLPPVPGIRMTVDTEPLIPIGDQFVMSRGVVFIEQASHD